MNVKKYLTLTRAGIIESLQFRLSSLVIIAGNFIYLIIVYYLWKAIYASVDTESVNGMTFSDTLIYLVLATSLFGFMEMYLVWQMGRDIQSGKIILDISKPMKYMPFMFWSLSGSVVMSFIMTFIPTFVAVYFLTNGAIHLGINILFFLITVVFAIIINFSIDFFIGTVCLYTESIWGINIMKEVIVLLLSGATIPIAFFPEPLKTIVLYLPFQSIYNVPLTILTKSEMPVEEVFKMMLTQVFWAAAAMFISTLFWKKSLKVITVNGG